MPTVLSWPQRMVLEVYSLYKEIEELLLRLYYLYEKSLKKTHELASIVEDFKEAFNFPGSGMFPYDLKFLAG